jgi:hypothetical protein
LKTISKIGANVLPKVVLFICLVLAGCSGPLVRTDVEPFAGEAPLDLWLENDLIPYLLQQFGQHPRFKDEPVLLVRIKGDIVRPSIDDLTNRVRGKIIDALLKSPGIELAWRPAIQPWQHHQRLEDVTCGEYRKNHYFIGIDCGLTRLKRNLYVKVRALNLAEQKWVTGFGRSWEGKPTEFQLAALDREHPDEYLRGLRPLPFSDRQPDLLAAYLARNLSCLLRQAETADDPVVYVENPAGHTPETIKTALDLVGKYLSRFREVEVTDDPYSANVTIISAIHTIHQDLHQVWISARHRPDKTYLAGAETEAYVLISGQPPAYGSGTQQTDSPVSLHLPDARGPKLISSFDLITPLNPGICESAASWKMGARRVMPDEHISSGGCLAVEMNLMASAFVFLVSQDSAGELTRMFPSDCRGLSQNDALLHPSKPFQFPSMADPEAGVLKLGGPTGMERVYAIAISGPNLADRFAAQLDEVQGLCSPGLKFPKNFLSGHNGSPYERIQHWQDYLNRLAINNPGLIQWREIRFWHNPS